MRTGGKRESEKGGWRGGRGLAHGPAQGHKKRNYDSRVCSSSGSSVGISVEEAESRYCRVVHTLVVIAILI